jgi:hypothetical protein
VKQKLKLFKKQKVENILAQSFVLFRCFIFSWEQTLRFRFENDFNKQKNGIFFKNEKLCQMFLEIMNWYV